MKTAMELLREALKPELIDMGISLMISEQRAFRPNNIADPDFLQDVVNLTRLRRMIVSGELRALAKETR